MTLKVVQHDHPALQVPTEPFSFSNPPTDPVQLARDLFEAMIKSNHMSLSANQCGLPYRVFALASNPGIVAFNPKIVDNTSDASLLEEVCASHPGLVLKVMRPAAIKVRYTEPNGNVVTTKFVGMTARLFQHELDHLDGIDFTDRAHPIHLEQARRRLKKQKRQNKKEQK